MMPRTRRWLIMTPLLGFAILLVYTVMIAVSGHERTDVLMVEIADYETRGLVPEYLPEGWLDQLLQVEDPAFMTHVGVDFSTAGAGMTTLTQGLVKIHYFEQFRPGLAKYKQTILALVMDSRLTKRQQLLLFLNTARLGHRNGEPVRGFNQAARVWFDRPFEELSNEQYLMLVAMLVGPARYNPGDGVVALTDRVHRIRRLLAGQCKPAGLMDVYYENCVS